MVNATTRSQKVENNRLPDILKKVAIRVSKYLAVYMKLKTLNSTNCS